MTKLAIVESPSKIRRVAAYLGDGWVVEASRGHVRDLPETELGIDLDHGFEPQYHILKRQRGLVSRLKKAIRAAEAIYIATDEDREGEAIGWHILELAKAEVGDKPVYRLRFNALTKQTVLTALASPQILDRNLVEAQQTRRVVDRLVGYLVSPLACQALEQPVSAGRVQSVCLRLVVDREREIQAFVPTNYWILALKLTGPGGEFTARLAALQDKRAVFRQREPLDQIIRGLADAIFRVREVRQGEKARPPLPPFTTASLQQAASKALGLSPDHTMEIAQILYEAGQITYPRTDAVAVAPEAQDAARQFILQTYGSTYVPAAPSVYEPEEANAQEAHEAIRPTEVTRLPESLPPGKGTALYTLIWRRFVASQMADARYLHTAIRIAAARAESQPYPLDFQAHGRQLTFYGFLKAYEEPSDVDEPPVEDTALPMIREGDMLTVLAWLPETHTTQSPARYTEASLIKALAERGIGRPSTYAGMVRLIQDKSYVHLESKHLAPTEIGLKLRDFLVAHFPSLFDYDYTALLESTLDQVAAGQAARTGVVQTFWDAQLASPLKTLAAELQPTLAGSASPKVVGICPACGGKLVEHRTARSTVTRCEHFPTCKGQPVRFTSARKVKQA